MIKTTRLLFLFVLILCAVVSTSNAQQLVGDSDSDVSINLKGIDGKRYDVSRMRGNFIVVAFGATWCQPCHEELRDLEVLHLEFKDRPVNFMWISVDDKDQMSDGDLRKFAKQLNFTFPILRDPDKQTYKQFSQRTRLPLVVIIDKAGKVVKPNQFGASSQPGVFRINMRNRLKQLFVDGETVKVQSVDRNLPGCNC